MARSDLRGSPARGNHIAQAVSWAKAELTSVWNAGDQQAVRHHAPTMATSSIVFWWRSTRANGVGRPSLRTPTLPPTRSATEELADNSEGAALRVLHFLGLEDAAPLRATTRQQADSTNARWIARYQLERSKDPT
jgi:LPS sulfotransferase NodH